MVHTIFVWDLLFKPVLAFFRLAALGMQSGVEELTIIFVKHLPCVSNCSRHFHELYHLLLTTTLEGRCFCSHFYIKPFVTLRAVPTQLLQPFGPEANTHALYYLLNSPSFCVSLYVCICGLRVPRCQRTTWVNWFSPSTLLWSRVSLVSTARCTPG